MSALGQMRFRFCHFGANGVTVMTQHRFSRRFGNSGPGSRARASGATLIGTLLVASALIAGLTMVLKLGPHYLDWQTMQTVFDGLPKSEIREMSKGDIRESVAKRFRVNNLRDFELRKILTIDEAKEGTTLRVRYEKREHLAFNIDVVLVFSEQYRYQ